jgi:hypothetical protein
MGVIPKGGVKNYCTKDITDGHWDLIPYPPFVNTDIRARKYSRRENKHIDYGVLKT